MALTVLEEIATNAACNAVVDLIDVGTAGTFTICDGASVLATGTFSGTAFGAASAGVATKNAITNLVADGAGVADNLKVYDDDTIPNLIMTIEVVEGVEPVAGKCVLTNTTIAIGDVIPIASWTHTQPAAA